MYLRQFSRHALRATLVGVAVTLGAVAKLPARQSTDSTRATTATATPDSTTAATPWRNYVSQTDTTAPRTARRNAFAPGAVDGGQNTIVISTLALVLIVVIVVLLIR